MRQKKEIKLEEVTEKEEVVVEKETKKKEDKKEIIIDETFVLRFQLINTQVSLIKKSIENLEVQKQVYMLEQNTVMENYNNFKKDIKEKFEIDFDEYNIDLEKNKLIKKDIPVRVQNKN